MWLMFIGIGNTNGALTFLATRFVESGLAVSFVFNFKIMLDLLLLTLTRLVCAGTMDHAFNFCPMGR